MDGGTFQCPLCKLMFGRNEKLYDHIRWQHPLVCLLCGKVRKCNITVSYDLPLPANGGSGRCFHMFWLILFREGGPHVNISQTWDLPPPTPFSFSQTWDLGITSLSVLLTSGGPHCRPVQTWSLDDLWTYPHWWWPPKHVRAVRILVECCFIYTDRKRPWKRVFPPLMFVAAQCEH